MSIEERYKLWIKKTKSIYYLHDELTTISDKPDEIVDRFWCDLAFGTGGLRGRMGAGTNRVNLFTIGKATQGLANYLKLNCKSPSVSIAYDTRNYSVDFAQHATSILCANGIFVNLYDNVRPTPMLSFAVRHLKSDAGIVITASHNPKEYNGYKIYGNDGGQITDLLAEKILNEINRCDIFEDVKSMTWQETQKSVFFNSIGENVDVEYYKKVKELSMRHKLLNEYAKDLKILYSPLHGSGNIPVRRVLNELGFAQIDVVEEQELPDGNFSTTPCPNPEEPSVYKLAIKKANLSNPDLVFATDPDADRIGILVKDNKNKYKLLTGNQVGVLLTDYIIRTHNEQNTMPNKPAVIKTIVTSDMSKVICHKSDVDIRETLTGFKYIGELISTWEKTNAHTFLFGFEESYGYLAGDFVRDKDAIIASILIAEMAVYYKSQGISLFEALEQLYREHGYYKEELISTSMEGRSGQEKIKNILDNLRENYMYIFKHLNLVEIKDFQFSRRTIIDTNKTSTLNFPKSNVLKFIMDDGSWIVFRPSGTEPKIKVYLSSNGKTRLAAEQRMFQLRELCYSILK